MILEAHKAYTLGVEAMHEIIPDNCKGARAFPAVRERERGSSQFFHLKDFSLAWPLGFSV
jgi:hypothetical protein